MSVRPPGDATGDQNGDAAGDGDRDAATGDGNGDVSGGSVGGRALPRMIASAPWVVVLVGVAVLAVLLVVALLSFRGAERPADRAPGPPMVLPTAAGGTEQSPAPAEPTASTNSAVTPTAPATPTGSPTATGAPAGQTDRSPTGAPPRSEATRSPSASAPVPVGPTGEVTASYWVQDSGDAEHFEARLVVRNGTDRSSDWQVELRFNDGVTGIRASSGPGVSVTIRGSGWYLLSGTGVLGAGAQQSVQLRFARSGGGEYPALCTINGATCGID